MNKYLKIVLFGFLIWLIPFIASFLFMDQSGNFLIHKTFFKSIMIVVGGLVGVTLAVTYFKEIGTDHVKEGITIGVVWLVINLGLDLVLVSMGFFPMTVTQYFAHRPALPQHAHLYCRYGICPEAKNVNI